MTIVGALPYDLTDGTTAVGAQVLADINKVRNDVNSNAAANGVNSDITALTGLTNILSLAPSSKACFSANKNASDQAIASASPTLVTWNNTIYNTGSFYSTSTSLWTPPVGKIQISACLAGKNIGTSNYLILIVRKNGTARWGMVAPGDATWASVASGNMNFGGPVVSLTVNDVATGTDTYGIYTQSDDSSYSIEGEIGSSWFVGTMI